MSGNHTTETEDTWRFCLLHQVCEVRYGLGQPPEKDPDGVPMIRATNVKRGRISEQGLIRIKKSAIPTSRNPYLESGDIIVVRSGAYTGDVAMIDDEWAGSVAGYDLVVTPGKQVEPAFCMYALLSPDVQKHFNGLSNRAAQAHINRQQLEATPIPLPPLTEQQAIAKILSTTQKAIKAQERIIQTTTELKQALMQKLFSEGLRGEPQKQTEIGLAPESWEVVSLSEVCQFLSGGTPSKQNPEFWQGSIPWVSPKDMKRPRLNDAQDHISQEGLESGSKLAPAGSVLVVVRGMILAKTVPVALAEVPVAINQDMKAIVPGPKLTSDYLLYSLEAFGENLFKRVGRSGHGTCTLMGHEVSAAKIPLPDIKTQEAIAHAIRSLENKRELHGFRLSLAKQLFQTLLSELMSGSIRAQDPSSPYLN